MYRSHVGPVELHDFIGSYCLDLLIGLGLKKHHKLLDVGCGCLRVGKHLINYLDSKNYTGIEPAKEIIQTAMIHELDK